MISDSDFFYGDVTGVPDNDSLEHLLPEFWFALLDTAQNHIARAAIRENVQAAADSLHRYNIQVLRTAVIRTMRPVACVTITRGRRTGMLVNLIPPILARACA